MRATLAFVVWMLCAVVNVAQVTYAPIVGATTPTSFTVAVRAPNASSVRVRYKPASESSYQTTAAVTPLPASDWAVQIPVTQLQPWTLYDYSVIVDGQGSNVYHTRTFPLDTDAPALRIGLLADHDSLTSINDVGKPLDAYATILGMQPDTLFQIGDFPHFNPAVYPVTPETIENWRLMHRTILSEVFPVGLSMWTPAFDQDPDDHDAAKNDASLATKADWRAWLIQSHDESYPSHARPSPTNGLWETYRIGQHVQVIKLDVRSQKQPKQSIEKPGHTMLGTEQKAWLKSTLLASTATWKVIISPLAWQTYVAKLDGWYGYQLERTELTNWLRSHNIRNVVFVSGDNHCGFLDDGTFSEFPEVNIPGTNTVKGCTSGSPGFGSHGVIDRPQNLPAGAFAWLDVSTTGDVTARLIRADGVTLYTMTLSPQ